MQCVYVCVHGEEMLKTRIYEHPEVHVSTVANAQRQREKERRERQREREGERDRETERESERERKGERQIYSRLI